MPTPYRYLLAALMLASFSVSAHAQCKPGQTPVFGNFGGISCKGTPSSSSGSVQRSTPPSRSRSSSGTPSSGAAAGALIGAGTAAAATIFGGLGGAPASSNGSSGYGGAEGVARQYAACAEVFDQNVQESNSRIAIIKKIDENDHEALCRYGHEIGHPGLQTALRRIQSSPVCDPGDQIVAAVVKAMKTTVANNAKAVANDCRLAKIKSRPETCGVSQGEPSARECASESGSKSCYCIPLTNTCSRESGLKARLSYKVTGVANSRSVLMEPQETVLEACTTRREASISLGSFRLSKY